MELSIHDTKYGKFLLSTEDNISRHVMRGEFWEPELLTVFSSLNKDSVIVEIGSFIGDHTVYLSKHFRKVYAFEGQRRNYFHLMANLFLNDCYNNVETYNYVMGNGNKVRPADKEHRDEWPLDLVANASGARFVEGDDYVSVRIDDLNLEPFQLLKVDAEGMDLTILRGAEQSIRKYKPVILFEHNGLVSDSPMEAYYIFLDSIDYTYDRIGEYNWLAKPKQGKDV